MSKPADEIEREVEASRGRLDRTLDTLQSRLDVSGVTANLMSSAWRARMLHGNTARVVDASRANPLPVLLILSGLGYLVYDTARRAAEARRLALVPGDLSRTNTDSNLAGNSQDRLDNRLNDALEESFPGSDPVSVQITR
ncbi:MULTISPECIES: DUF3618 domain-containing protein [unclassified Methylobacterium]|uniref:DUF3618 domain-containing protein n=1 Tax=unclassified Methylobacterium TaxID=2615210 RepID=UPI001D0C836C|nr:MULTISPECIES: DUF3618 domain-containing protein [unclassified Methylobacterium]MCC0808047.1 DUF3618 domain-containing protein [Methylobacterium sp. W2]MCJ2127285.1 DUF3618 domain-containing protein [Methylobacterium sp. E-045]